MKCDKCGYLLLEGDNFCRNCGNTISINRNVVPEQKSVTTPIQNTTPVQQNVVNNISDEDNKKANKLCIWSLILYFAAPILFVLFDVIIALLLKDSNMIGISAFSVLCRIAGFVLMIVAKIKYPKNKFANILMWIYIGLIAAGFVMGILAVIIILLLLFSLA